MKQYTETGDVLDDAIKMIQQKFFKDTTEGGGSLQGFAAKPKRNDSVKKPVAAKPKKEQLVEAITF